jgi:peptidoglycan hydrolase-like protein with peptidoglycan-binding domain
MSRILFARSADGYRAPRGELIRRVQTALAAGGWNPGPIDGVYGSATGDAVRAFQVAAGLPPDGCLSFDGWSRLVPEQAPSVVDRCLQVTADFEGHGFGKATGNFDGAGITWGILGFTLRHGEIQSILSEVRRTRPPAIAACFGALQGELWHALEKPIDEQVRWADGISVPGGKAELLPDWAEAFRRLADFEEVRNAQMRRVIRYWNRAVEDARRFALDSELGIALCFDIAVQNGGIDHEAEERRIAGWIAAHPEADEEAKRACIADVVAESAQPQWVEDVRRRKRALATGEGTVHGARYRAADWGLAAEPWAD